ncbi:MarR family winged helix-turn-helix transcriptional regulator [Intrasporangium sp.]|uniref:MarR family winged helix-turn-helix transcriptional regulator n=1 Tax=Intrasporangium sp. TaxID=1925024 RepID=UPI00293A5F8B|nr:MarR family winged helix-turn-helix transcriptional regulator [Intrasporangium sp.]MDV3221082.1 MarR family winged helix-turn-helix transcriptional regulator [Intrasporangium sp.]
MSRRAERLYEAIRHIRPVHQYSARAVATSLAAHDITMPMRAVIERLDEAGPQTVPQVARSLWITRQGVQRIVDDAKALGYVETRANPEHRRSHLVVLTESGRAAYAALHESELVTLDGIAAGVSEEDVEACIRVLSHLTHELRERFDTAAPDAGWETPGPRPGEEVR